MAKTRNASHEVYIPKFTATQRALARKSFEYFCGLITPEYTLNWHHKVLCGKLQKLQNGEVTRMMVACPPQHQKSTYSSILFPAWALGVDPDEQIGFVSYNAGKAEEFNRSVQKVMDMPEYREIFPDSRLAGSGKGQNIYVRNSERFDIVGKKGFFKSIGIGGSFTGTPATLIIIDDPIKDKEEYRSVTGTGGLLLRWQGLKIRQG